MIAPGTPAPDFSLPNHQGTQVSLVDFRGRRLVLVFYPLDFSPTCTDQLSIYQEVLPLVEEQGAALVGVSVDSTWAHRAFREQLGISIPLLSDFEPKGEVARTYHVYRAKEGTSERALFLIDADGIIRWSYVSPVGVNAGADGILRALEDLEKKGA